MVTLFCNVDDAFCRVSSMNFNTFAPVSKSKPKFSMSCINNGAKSWFLRMMPCMTKAAACSPKPCFSNHRTAVPSRGFTPERVGLEVEAAF